MILQTILGHKRAVVGAALLLGTTTAAAVTGNVPFVADEDPIVVDEAQPDEANEEPTGSTPTTTEATSTTSTTEAPADTTGEDSTDVDGELAGGDGGEILPPADEDGVPYGLVDCDEATTHGEYVSGVARDPRIEGSRGEIVSQAARTSCGKDRAATTPDEGEEPESDDAEDEDDEGADADERDRDANEAEGQERGKGNGNANGNGNGQGHGNGGGKKDR